MGGNFKRSRIGYFGFSPEVTQGNRCFKFKATGGSTTTIVCSDSAVAGYDNANIASAAGDFFKGLQIYFVTGNLAGTIADVTVSAYAGSDHTWTFATAAAAAANTDEFYVMGRLPASNLSFTVGTENLTREEFIRATLDRPSSLKGLDVVNGSFDMEMPGRVDAVTSTSIAPDTYSQFLQVIGTRSTTAGGTVAAGTHSTTVFDVTSATGMAVGGYVMVEDVYEVARIVAIDSAEITVEPAFSSAPLATKTVWGSEHWTPDDTGHQSVTFVNLADDQLFTMKGCVCNFGMSAEFGALVSASIEFTGDAYTVDTSAVTSFAFDSINSKTVPFITGRVIGRYAASDTELFVGNFDFDMGNGVELLRDTNENQQALIVTREAQVSLSYRDRDGDKNQATSAETLGLAVDTYIQIGNRTQNCIGLFGKAQTQDPSSLASRTGGVNYWDSTQWFVDDSTDVLTPSKPILFRF